MHPAFANVLKAVNDATYGMTEEQLTYHPAGKWSSAQILEHLALAFGGTAKVFERAMTEGKPLGDEPTWKQRVQNFVVLDLGYLPGGRTAPKQVTPQASCEGRKSLELLGANLAAMDRFHEQCSARVSRERCLANHPILGPLTVDQWPKFHWVHTRHHMKQIRSLRLAQQGK